MPHLRVWRRPHLAAVCGAEQQRRPVGVQQAVLQLHTEGQRGGGRVEGNDECVTLEVRCSREGGSIRWR